MTTFALKYFAWFLQISLVLPRLSGFCLSARKGKCPG